MRIPYYKYYCKTSIICSLSTLNCVTWLPIIIKIYFIQYNENEKKFEHSTSASELYTVI